MPDEETISTLSLSLSLSLSFVLEHPESRKEKPSENQQPRPTFTGFSLPSFFLFVGFFLFFLFWLSDRLFRFAMESSDAIFQNELRI